MNRFYFLPAINPLSSLFEWMRYIFDLTRFDETLFALFVVRQFSQCSTFVVNVCDVTTWILCCAIWAYLYRAHLATNSSRGAQGLTKVL